MWGVIIYPRPNFNDGLAKPMQLGHRRVSSYQKFMLMHLHIYALNSVLFWLIFVSNIGCMRYMCASYKSIIYTCSHTVENRV